MGNLSEIIGTGISIITRGRMPPTIRKGYKINDYFTVYPSHDSNSNSNPKKKPIVFVNGLIATQYLWNDYIRNNKDRDVFIYDPTTLFSLTKRTEVLIESLKITKYCGSGSEIVLVGYSFGTSVIGNAIGELPVKSDIVFLGNTFSYTPELIRDVEYYALTHTVFNFIGDAYDFNMGDGLVKSPVLKNCENYEVEIVHFEFPSDKRIMNFLSNII